MSNYQIKLFAISIEIILDLFLLSFMLTSRSYTTTLSTNEFRNEINQNGFIKMTPYVEPKLNYVEPVINTIKSFLDDPFNFDIYSYLLNIYTILFGIILIRWFMIFYAIRAATNYNQDGKENIDIKMYSRMYNSSLSIIRVQVKKSLIRS